MTKKDTTPKDIQAKIGPGFLRRIFGGKSYLHCVIELKKNTRDYGAKNIWIQTVPKEYFKIVDDGDGMGHENRCAFFSINTTTATRADQAGLFCTGTKQFLFSFASHVTVVTAPREEPDAVYRFSFSADEYEKIVLSGGTRTPERVKKTPATWPYDHDFGTEIVYTLDDPKSRSILRGKQLAEALAERLPSKFHDISRVDGEYIPPKEIVGKKFELVEDHPALGRVSVEFYHPAKKSRDDGLRLTSVEIGEIPMRNLFRVLGDLQENFPFMYLRDDIYGIISASFLREYSNEDRNSVSAKIADDPRTLHLIRFLRQIAPQVQRDLQLKMTDGSSVDALRQSVDELWGIFDKRYNPDGRRPPPEGPPVGPPPPPPPPPPTGEKRTLVLSVGREFELGEKVVVQVAFREDLAKASKVEDIQWLTSRSRGKDFRRTSEGINYKASEVGEGVIRADLPGTPYGASATYYVLERRRFRLSRQEATLIVCSSTSIEGVNLDKLKGEIKWSLEGVGSLEVRGTRVVYTSDRIGTAIIRALDSKDPRNEAMCDVTVVDIPEKLFCIRGEYFRIRYEPIEGSTEYSKPVIMLPGGRTHNLVFNIQGHGYQEAVASGGSTVFLAQAIGVEFARFVRFELKRELPEDPRDMRTLVDEILSDGYKIFEEALENCKKQGR